MSDKVFNVLFLGTGNSARSIMAEVQLNALGRGRFKAFSAGSHPGGTVNPFAIALLQKARFSIEGLLSKSWDEFAGPCAIRPLASSVRSGPVSQCPRIGVCQTPPLLKVPTTRKAGLSGIRQ